MRIFAHIVPSWRTCLFSTRAPCFDCDRVPGKEVSFGLWLAKPPIVIKPSRATAHTSTIDCAELTHAPLLDDDLGPYRNNRPCCA
eukprot:2262899-Heterocapsa_arctica.AAC.1